ncbi:purine-nucleoside phosphorylase [Campylobacter sp.]|uniref:purine-nucleoside phosphorylase n=1 Tax=Campylobacter sp. TaxID=205 RepID=UPI0026FC8369|nr:purine-nucleoside phosphorylase [Campylobacter sp.]
MIISAGRNEIFDFALPMGVGLVDMSINLTKFLSENSANLPSEIVFVGSGGLYKDGKIFEIYESIVGANVEISSLEGKSYTPCETQISSVQICDKNLNAKVPRETIRVNSSNFITTDQNLAFKLFEMGYFLENMEFFAVLKVAEKFKIPARGIFIATNFCNQNAHEDFLKNHQKAKEILINSLKERNLI